MSFTKHMMRILKLELNCENENAFNKYKEEQEAATNARFVFVQNVLERHR